ncbi:hypothetical protein SRHO_G00178910 [Serrasalmus rhombeus]
MWSSELQQEKNFTSNFYKIQNSGSAEDQRFSLDDDTAARVFTITITDLRAEDGGRYWCGVILLPSLPPHILLHQCRHNPHLSPVFHLQGLHAAGVSGQGTLFSGKFKSTRGLCQGARAGLWVLRSGCMRLNGVMPRSSWLTMGGSSAWDLSSASFHVKHSTLAPFSICSSSFPKIIWMLARC